MLDQMLQVVARSLSPELAPPEVLDPLSAIAAQLPDALTHSLGLECRLGPGPSPVDLVILLATGEQRRILAGTHPRIDLPDALVEHPVWRRVRTFARLWDDPGSSLHTRVENVWLELDADRVVNGVPVPGVFFQVDGGARADAADPAWITGEALSVLRGEPLPPALREAVEACFGQARGRARVLHVGVFPARGMDAVRLFLHPFPEGGLASFLDAAGWPGRVADVAAAAEELAGLADDLYLNVDVGPAGVQPRIGVECHFRGLAQPASEPRWGRLLDHLAGRGACTPSKCRALLDFPGATVEDFLYRRPVHRGLHHVKVVLQPGRPPEAKAYLGALHGPAGRVEARAAAVASVA
ncbi:MAG TPA: hypothetical protein VFS20_24165 [Longimicrobium sp.]|nr:hypothetical protein [Longimicrobium sp.]